MKPEQDFDEAVYQAMVEVLLAAQRQLLTELKTNE